jgi:hypothetical protein
MERDTYVPCHEYVMNEARLPQEALLEHARTLAFALEREVGCAVIASSA